LLVVLRGEVGGAEVASSSCDRAKVASPS